MPNAKILLVEDERLLGHSIQRFLKERHECEWLENVEAAIRYLRDESVDVIVSDIKLPGKTGIELLRWASEQCPHTPVILITAHSSIPDAVAAIRQGAADYLSKPLDLETLELSINRALRHNRLQQEVRYHRRQAGQAADDANFFTIDSPTYQQLEQRVYRLLEVEKLSGEVPSILITGETGCGKGVLARRIHQQSPRSSEPFIEINATAIPETMVESELFGHEKGSFTGALSQRAGLFELADGGTLFLDEIGHLPLGVQAKLLKVLEDKRLRRIGGSREISVNVRIIAATNANLPEAIRRGEFREDLYHRLAFVHLPLPPLREMSHEIPALVLAFLKEALRKYAIPHRPEQVWLSAENRQALQHHSWPGNLRELRNEVERSVLFHGLEQLTFSHLRHLRPGHVVSSVSASPQEDGKFLLSEEGCDLLDVEARLLAQAFRQADGEQEEMAQLLHMTQRELEFRLQRYSLDWQNAPGWDHPIPKEGVRVSQVEQSLLKQALERTRNNVTGAARLLNLSRDQMRYRLEKYQPDS